VRRIAPSRAKGKRRADTANLGGCACDEAAQCAALIAPYALFDQLVAIKF